MDISTSGISLNYAVETSAGVMPSAFTKIPNVKSIPEMNPAPDTLETTTLDATEFKTYIEGLKDLGGSLSFGANLSDDLMDVWDDIMEAYETAVQGKKAMWFAVIIPEMSKSVVFTGQPSALGMPAVGVNSVLETNFYITPTSAPKWVDKSSITA